MGRGRPPKFSYEKAYKAFKKQFPNLSKVIVKWEPNAASPDCIDLWLPDGDIFVYSFVQQTAWRSRRRWT